MRYGCLATFLLPLVLAAQTNPTTPSDQKCTISGRTTSAADGSPLGKATLHLAPNFRGSQSMSRYMAVSNADGSFQFLNIEPGTYKLSADRNGFLQSSYGARRPGGSGKLITVKAGQQLADVKMTLAPQAVISGKLVDEDGDSALADGVAILQQTWIDGKLTYRMRQGTSVDDRGYFRASGLAPGKYIVCAQIQPNQNRGEEIPSGGKSPVGPVTTCYPSATNIEAAASIAVQSGQELDGVNIRVRSMRTFHVRGKIAGTLPQGTNQNELRLQLAPENIGLVFFDAASRIQKNGSFDIANVGPGSYDLSLFDFSDSPVALAKAPVSVSSTDVNGVVLNAMAPGDLHGTVRVEGTAPSGDTESVEITLLSEESNHIYGPPPQASADADGTFSILKVPAAKYRVNVMGVPSGAYLSAVRFNNQDLPDKVIDLSQGASGELEIVFQYGAVEVAGTVQMPQGAAASGLPSVSIVAVPDSGSGSVDDMKFGATDQNGTFTLHGLAPGAYHVYALEEGNRSLLQNPAVLKAMLDKSVEIEVKENDKKQVQLPLISDDDMRQLLTALGIDEE